MGFCLSRYIFTGVGLWAQTDTQTDTHYFDTHILSIYLFLSFHPAQAINVSSADHPLLPSCSSQPLATLNTHTTTQCQPHSYIIIKCMCFVRLLYVVINDNNDRHAIQEIMLVRACTVVCCVSASIIIIITYLVVSCSSVICVSECVGGWVV